MNPRTYIEAARVPDELEDQSFGFWTIMRRPAGSDYEREAIGFDTYTLLCHMTLASMHLEAGDIVMEDSAQELRRHLPIWLAASGRVLVTGLGLGCVVRGLLASPSVEHIDVVEIDRDILRIVGAEFTASPRVTLHEGDALRFNWPADTRWDFAWHDLWMEGDGLQLLHGKLIQRYRNRCPHQGAWMFPRWASRMADTSILGSNKAAKA